MGKPYSRERKKNGLLNIREYQYCIYIALDFEVSYKSNTPIYVYMLDVINMIRPANYKTIKH